MCKNESSDLNKPMKILQTKSQVNNGEITIKVSPSLNQQQVEVFIFTTEAPNELETMRQQAITNGYDSKQKILDLIQQVKREIIIERGLYSSPTPKNSPSKLLLHRG